MGSCRIPRTVPPELPLRLYRQGLPYRELGPPQSVWEADKNAALLALSDRVQLLEGQLSRSPAASSPQRGAAEPRHAPSGVQLPPPTVAMLPVPRNALGQAVTVANLPAFDGSHAAGAPPTGPVLYYPPPPPGAPLPPEVALARVPAAQSVRGAARAFAAAVEAAAVRVPSVMMRRAAAQRESEPPEAAAEDADAAAENQALPAGPAATAAGAVPPGSGSAVGVSAPRGHARPAAAAAAAVHTAVLRESAPLQPAGPYPMVSAALATGVPGSGASTWEQSKMRAVVSLEQQLLALKAQVG